MENTKHYAVARECLPLKIYEFMITIKPLGGRLVGICLFVKIFPLRCIFLAQGVDGNQACWLHVYHEALIRKKWFDMTSSMFSYLAVSIQTGKPFELGKVFSHMAVHSVTKFYFLVHLKLSVKLEPSSSLYFGLGISNIRNIIGCQSILTKAASGCCQRKMYWLRFSFKVLVSTCYRPTEQDGETDDPLCALHLLSSAGCLPASGSQAWVMEASLTLTTCLLFALP